jgi:hypothetical protein
VEGTEFEARFGAPLFFILGRVPRRAFVHSYCASMYSEPTTAVSNNAMFIMEVTKVRLERPFNGLDRAIQA